MALAKRYEAMDSDKWTHFWTSMKSRDFIVSKVRMECAALSFSKANIYGVALEVTTISKVK